MDNSDIRNCSSKIRIRQVPALGERGRNLQLGIPFATVVAVTTAEGKSHGTG